MCGARRLGSQPARARCVVAPRGARFRLQTTMKQTFLAPQKDLLLLLSRILLVILFVIFGWEKLLNFSGTAQFMAAEGTPLPSIAAVVAVAMEFFVGIALLLGFCTRPLALLLGLYTLGTAFIGHHYWSMPAAEQMNMMIHFYKNIAITGGLLALCAAGPGRYSLDRG
ncbi:DoxX family protein [Burkholderia pseudomallei Pakistan 9]|nr:DoxX family protein [Burkholderia pseudomallei S13]EEC37804.1 DoxX family protein [Burkholderia pseudomallei 576]EEH26311.1 DoxX family protein [Burkholderia pseudomallei Pakistan 9]EEP50301.1 DoxX family protein [Burkholderia pseudomallei MSHR346]